MKGGKTNAGGSKKKEVGDERSLLQVVQNDEFFSYCEEGTSEDEVLRELGSKLAKQPMSFFRNLLVTDGHVALEDHITTEMTNKDMAVFVAEEIHQWLEQKRAPKPTRARSATKEKRLAQGPAKPTREKTKKKETKAPAPAPLRPPTKTTSSLATPITKGVVKSKGRRKIQNNASVALWGALDGKITAALSTIQTFSGYREELHTVLQNLGGILIKLLLKTDAASSKNPTVEKVVVPLYKGTFFSWVLTLRKYIHQILITRAEDVGHLVRVRKHTDESFWVTFAPEGSAFKTGQRDWNLQQLRVTCACGTLDILKDLHKKRECKEGYTFKAKDDFVLLRTDQRWEIYKESALTTERLIAISLKSPTSHFNARKFITFALRALRSYDTDLDTLLSLTEESVQLAQFLETHSKTFRPREEWWKSMDTGDPFRQVNDQDTLPGEIGSCLKMIEQCKPEDTRVELRFQYLKQALVEARGELEVLQHFSFNGEHKSCFGGGCETYQDAFRFGRPFLTDSKSLMESSISVVLTQLDETLLLFEALNAGTRTPTKTTMKRGSGSVRLGPSGTTFEFKEDAGLSLEYVSSAVPSHSDYVQRLCPGLPEKPARTSNEMKQKNTWLTLAKSKEGSRKADELTKNWKLEIQYCETLKTPTNAQWRTNEEHDFLYPFFGKGQRPFSVEERQQAVHLEILFLSDRLHVDRLFHSKKERSFLLLSKYLRRVLDIGVILGCLKID